MSVVAVRESVNPCGRFNVKSRFFILPATALAVLAGAGPSQAITSGELDAGAHPYVGFARGLHSSCTATAVSPRLVVTAAHCFTVPTRTALGDFDQKFPTNPLPRA